MSESEEATEGMALEGEGESAGPEAETDAGAAPSREAESGADRAGETGTADQPPSYEVAVERLETIIDRLDSGQAGLRETLNLCSEGRELITYCAGELEAVGEGLRELRLDELAARLETTPAGDAEG